MDNSETKPKPLSYLQKKIVANYYAGMSLLEAAKLAGAKSKSEHALKNVARRALQQHILQEFDLRKYMTEAGLHVANWCQSLGWLKRTAREKGNLGAYYKALELQARALRLLSDEGQDERAKVLVIEAANERRIATTAKERKALMCADSTIPKAGTIELLPDKSHYPGDVELVAAGSNSASNSGSNSASNSGSNFASNSGSNFASNSGSNSTSNSGSKS